MISSAPQGKIVEIITYPIDGYRVKSVKVNEIETVVTKVSTNNYKFTMPKTNVEVSVEFELIPVTYTVSITSGTNFTADPTGPITVNKGANQDITITANAGYKLTSVKVDNIEKISTLTEGVLSLADIQADTIITVEVEKITKAVTIREIENGIVTSDKATVAPGETVTLTVTPSEGYKLREIKLLDMYDEMPITLN